MSETGSKPGGESEVRERALQEIINGLLKEVDPEKAAVAKKFFENHPDLARIGLMSLINAAAKAQETLETGQEAALKGVLINLFMEKDESGCGDKCGLEKWLKPKGFATYEKPSNREGK